MEIILTNHVLVKIQNKDEEVQKEIDRMKNIANVCQNEYEVLEEEISAEIVGDYDDYFYLYCIKIKQTVRF